MIRSAHIFCRIVDNFGDIGICWRLARQLAHERHMQVCLWVDDLPTFRKLEPSLDINAATQTLAGITIAQWHEPFSPPAQLPELVIETFSCRLPDSYIAAMKATPQPPHWVNLDHLSAEPWVDGSHGLTSIHPASGLPRLFLFPGFTRASGGLLREQDLLAARDAFQRDSAAQQGWWQQHMPAPWPAAGTLKVSLFAYSFAPYALLMDALHATQRPVTLLVPQTITDAALVSSGQVEIISYPLLAQDDFDRLLWSCDLNFVRGEDSWVRAIWAGRPFVWQAYAQPENAHEAKISAFLQRYDAEMPKSCAQTLELAHGLWNLSARADPHALTGLLSRLPEVAVVSQQASQLLSASEASEDCVSRMLRLLNDRKI